MLNEIFTRQTYLNKKWCIMRINSELKLVEIKIKDTKINEMKLKTCIIILYIPHLH